VEIEGANVHDTKLLAATLQALVLERPDPAEVAQHLCRDKAYDNPTGERACAAAGYIPHIRRIGEEKLDSWGQKSRPARRWVVERTLAWLSKCRAPPRPLRQEAAELQGPHPARLRAAVVPPTPRPGWGEGVSR
jgi:putative transposase